MSFLPVPLLQEKYGAKNSADHFSDSTGDGIFVRDNISNISHIVGGLVGAGFGFVLGRRRRY